MFYMFELIDWLVGVVVLCDEVYVGMVGFLCVIGGIIFLVLFLSVFVVSLFGCWLM